jgi:ABC-type transport system involved in multi-copper enzyme maturation permease subunit
MNPVLHKDLVGLLRLKRVAAIQVGFVAVLALLVLGTWPQSGLVSGTVAIGKATGVSRLSDSLMLAMVLGQLVLLVLLVPGMAAVAVTSEREGGTLEMLYASRLSPLNIIMGKLGLAIAYPLLLLVSGLPFVALLAWRGELRTDQLLLSYGVLALSAIYLTILSLGISAVCRQGATAMVIAYLLVLITCGGVLVPGAIMLAGAQGDTAMLLHYVRGVSPVAAILSILSPRMGDMGGIERHMMPLWMTFIPFASAVSLAAVALIGAKLHKAPSTMEGFGAKVSGSIARRSWFRRFFFLIDPTKKRQPLGRGNPVMAKERRTSNLRSGVWMIRIFYVSLFLSLALAGMGLYGDPSHPDLMKYVVQILVALQIALVALVVPSLSTASVSGEIENGTFELLRLAPLSSDTIFWGKLIPSLPPALLPMAALLPAYLALVFIDPSYLSHLIKIAPVVLLSLLAMCILGLTCSTWLGNTARATVAAYVLAASLVILPMLVWWAGEAKLISMGAARWLICLSPMAMAMNLLPDSRVEIAELQGVHLGILAGGCLLMLLLARYRLGSLLRHG